MQMRQTASGQAIRTVCPSPKRRSGASSAGSWCRECRKSMLQTRPVCFEYRKAKTNPTPALVKKALGNWYREEPETRPPWLNPSEPWPPAPGDK